MTCPITANRGGRYVNTGYDPRVIGIHEQIVSFSRLMHVHREPNQMKKICFITICCVSANWRITKYGRFKILKIRLSKVLMPYATNHLVRHPRFTNCLKVQ